MEWRGIFFLHPIVQENTLEKRELFCQENSRNCIKIAKKPANFAGFCSWYLNTTGNMVDDNGLEPLTLRTSTFMLKRSRLVCAAEDPRRGSHRPPHQRSKPALQPITQRANSTFHCINIRVRIPSSSLNVRMS